MCCDTIVHIKSHYDLRYYIKSTKYGQEMCSFTTSMHNFVLVYYNGVPKNSNDDNQQAGFEQKHCKLSQTGW